MADLNLTSTETALAIVAPTYLRSEIDLIWSQHDKAYGRWEPHMNLIYPFVPITSIRTSMDILRRSLESKRWDDIKIAFDNVGVFKHHKRGTVYLKPTNDTEQSLRQLRECLLQALCEQTHYKVEPREFNPHLTLGQAPLGKHNSMMKELERRSRTLLPMEWISPRLVVLKRATSGDMVPIAELEFGNSGSCTISKDDNAGRLSQKGHSSVSRKGWKCCFQINAAGKWHTVLYEETSQHDPISRVLVASLNLMAEDYAPRFEKRLVSMEKCVMQLCDLYQETPRILCLQEVDPEMLGLIYGSRIFSCYFPYSSHTPTSLMRTRRNLVTLSSRPFRQFTLQYAQPHKTSLIAKMSNSNLTIVNVHLASAFTDLSVKIKKDQVQRLERFLSQNGLDSQTALVGDFNMTTSSESIQNAIQLNIIQPEAVQVLQTTIDPDRWGDAYITAENFENELEADEDCYPGEEGATFDCLKNPLAALSMKHTHNRPQRYDRVLYSQNGTVGIEQYGTFASNPDEIISDHYGIYSLMIVVEHLRSVLVSLPNIPLMEARQTETLRLVEDETDVESLISLFLPREEDRKRRTEAVEELRSILIQSSGLQDILIAPLGSYAMDTHFENSDMDVLIIGSVAPKQFFQTSVMRFLANSNAMKTHLVNSLVQNIEVVINGIKIDVQYCQAPEIIKRYSAHEDQNVFENIVLEGDFMSTLKPNTLRSLNTYRDTVFFLSTVNKHPAFRTAYRFISIYVRRRGMYSAKFGYLGGIHIALMLNRVVKLLDCKPMTPNKPGEVSKSLTAASMVRGFFSYYSAFDWNHQIVVDLSQEAAISTYKRSAREPIVIRSIFTPTARANVAKSCNKLTTQTIQDEFSLADQRLKEGHWRWCLRAEEEGLSDFFNGANIFIRIQVDVWSSDTQLSDQISSTVGYLESRMPTILVALGRISGLRARIWPARFVTADESTDHTDPTGYYLISISSPKDDSVVDAEVSNDGIKRSKIYSAALAYERFAQQYVASKEGVQPRNVWVTVDVVSKKKGCDMSLKIDVRDWSGSARTEIKETSHGMIMSQLKSQLPEGREPEANRNQTSRKLRPVQDVIARIKWDVKFDKNRYIIGYEDRFAGVMEIDLMNWKTEQTDLEFIPMHRIVWVKEKGADGEKVWDRRTKYDAVFQSGNSRMG